MEFNSSNFIVPGSSQDRLVQIRNTDGDTIYSILPCDVTRSYAMNNLLKLQTVNEIISIKFSSPSDAITALNLLNARMAEIIAVFPCQPLPDPTFTSANFLMPYSTQDKEVQIRNNSGDVVYTINPCDIRNTYSLISSLKIQTSTGNISILFESSSEASSALSLLNGRIANIISVFPCESNMDSTYSSSTFLVPYSTSDNRIQIRDTNGSIVYTIDHCNISKTYTITDTIRIQTINGLISIKFATSDEALSGLELLNNRLSSLKESFPCEPIPVIVPEVVTYQSTFTSDTFLLPYVDGERKVQIRNTFGVNTFTIDPCNVVLVYIKDSGRFVSLKSLGSENILQIEFSSGSDASIALNKLQERIDYIKGIYPCNGSAGFTFIQSLASDVWYINHRLNRRPTVFVMDGNYEEIEGLIRNIDNNNTNIYFNTPVSGSAYLI